MLAATYIRVGPPSGSCPFFVIIPARAEPIHPFERGKLYGLEIAPRTATLNHYLMFIVRRTAVRLSVLDLRLSSVQTFVFVHAGYPRRTYYPQSPLRMYATQGIQLARR